MNPEPPSLHATIKLRKPNAPIRSMINCKNAPAYELAKHLAKTLCNYLYLPYTYDIHNALHLIRDLKTIEINKGASIFAFEKKNMCTNIQKIETAGIITNILKINQNTQKEIIHILETIMAQHYFQYEQKYYKQTDGLAMGAPKSAVLSEAYIQNIEDK
jgi:hypothetical protein